MTTRQSASPVLQDGVKRGSYSLEPKAPPNGGGEVPDERPEFFTSSPLAAADLETLREGAGQAAALLRTVGNEQRLMVLCLLLQGGEMSVGALQQEVGLSQSALSQHLARLREEALVACRRESQTMYYRISDPAVGRLIATLKDIFCP